MSNVIQLDNITKTYGQSRGVTEVSLVVEKGAIFGFLGPNGAGKSTTINMLVDLIRPSAGKILIFGLDSQKDSLEIRRRIGFLTGDMALDSQLTGLQQLTYFANLRGDVPMKNIGELASMLDLNLHRKIKALSRGNRQKVGLISALMHDPDLLVLDEPTTGLDPIIQAQFNKIILDHKKRGKTTFLSSHLLSEIQEIYDEVAFIREGQIIDVQHMNDITANSPKVVHVTSADRKLLAEFKKLKGVTVSKSDQNTVDLTFAGDINDLLDLLAKHNVKDVTIQEADLESVFMSYYGDSHV